MTITNFDQSSNGLNLELSCEWDTDLSRFWFDETFKVLQHSGYRQNSVLVYGKNMIDVNSFDLSDHENYNIKDSKALILACLKEENLTGYEEIRDCLNYIGTSSDTLSDLMLGITEYLGYESIQDFLQEHFDPLFVTVKSRGYSQGDYSEIIIPQAVVNEFTDQTLETIGEFLQDEIDHLLWDAPLYCRITVGGEEYNLTENIKDLYNYDQNGLVESFKGFETDLSEEQKQIVLDFLNENLPDTPDYN